MDNTKEEQPNKCVGQGADHVPDRSPRQQLNAIFEDEAKRLEVKAKDLRTVNGLIPMSITQEQFQAMLSLILKMRS